MPSGIVRCPYCNKDLGDFSDEFITKHTSHCSTRLNPYVYSDRGRGRPSKKEKQEFLRAMGRL